MNYGETNLCGLAGVFGSTKKICEDVGLAQQHRGPDAYTSRSCKLGTLFFNRLSILDISCGHQPMVSNCGNVILVFNGEIYNHREIRAELEILGKEFRTNHSDTEVILQGYLCWGYRIFEKLNGMFAIAILDELKEELILSRDTFGIKPLFYSREGESVYFASEIKMLQILNPCKEILQEKIYESLAFKARRGSQTAFKGIKELQPGQILKFKSGFEEQQIFAFDSTSATFCKDMGGIKLRDKITEAVDRWSQADVAITLSLSGGLDSSIIATTLAKDLNRKIKCYTFSTLGNDKESTIARKTAEKLGLDLTEISVDEEQFAVTIPEMIDAIGEPYSGDLPSWFVYKRVHEDGYKVVITGTGGDEMFGNYGKHKITLSKIIRYLAKNKKIIKSMPFDLTYFPNYNNELRLTGLLKNFQIPYGPKDWSLRTLRRNIYDYDLKNQLPNEFLLVTDRFSSRHSVEARTPFLDQELTAVICNNFPLERYQDAPFKGYLRSIYRADLVPEVLEPMKSGFTVQNTKLIHKYLAQLRDYYFSDGVLDAQGIFDRSAAQEILKSNQKTGKFDHLFWAIFSFQCLYFGGANRENSLI